MSARKLQLRQIVLDIVTGKEQVSYDFHQFTSLLTGVAEVLGKQSGRGRDYGAVFGPEAKLDADDSDIVREIFWDLVVEKILTIGSDSANPNFPWFKLHSEATSNLKSNKD